MEWGSTAHWAVWLAGLLAVFGLAKVGDLAKQKSRALYAAVFVAHIGLALMLAATFPYMWGQTTDEGCRTEFDRAGSFTVCD
jgi:asparagine N-glycosylation enzyme membrane subunit Stt3